MHFQTNITICLSYVYNNLGAVKKPVTEDPSCKSIHSFVLCAYILMMHFHLITLFVICILYNLTAVNKTVTESTCVCVCVRASVFNEVHIIAWALVPLGGLYVNSSATCITRSHTREEISFRSSVTGSS